jgi:hypothetical protein
MEKDGQFGCFHVATGEEIAALDPASRRRAA